MRTKVWLVLVGCMFPVACWTPFTPSPGSAAIARYGCGSCHTIEQIPNARGMVGPPLTGLRNRVYIAGMLHNRRQNLIHWIRNPKAVNPKTAMPNLGVTDKDANTIASYLYEK